MGDFDVLVFELAGQRFGLPAGGVREVLRAVAVTPLPRAPAVVEGVVNLRGRVVPVFDLRGRFGLPPKAVEPADHLVIADAGPRLVALRVDRAADLVRIAAGDLEDARGVVPGCDHVAWVARQPDGVVLIHDLATFLSRAEADGLDAALAGGGGA